MRLISSFIHSSLLFLKECFIVGVPDWSTFDYRAGSGVDRQLWAMGYVIIHGVPAPVPAYVRNPVPVYVRK